MPVSEDNSQLDALARIKIVLVEPQHPGNIGAAARAMKVMGLSQLALVQPHHFPDSQASARASGATDILSAATVYDRLDQAIADCHFIVGTSARQRHTQWPLTDARQATSKAMAQAQSHHNVAVVFGRERSGLTNAELDRCQLHLRIPTNPGYASLNLAAAVQVVSYELRVASTQQKPVEVGHEPVNHAQMEGLFDHWTQVLTASGFLDPNEPKLLMRRLRRLFNRASPDKTEMNILRGALNSLDPRK